MSIIPYFFLESVVSINQLTVKDNKSELFCIGSGFIVNIPTTEKKGYVSVITNKHVIKDQKIIYLRFNKLNGNESKDFKLELYDSNNHPNFSLHPQEDIDIVAIHINTSILANEGYAFSSFNLNEHALQLKQMQETGINEGNFIYVLGFPMNLQDQIKTPIVRLGCISRIQHIYKNSTLNNFIIDSQIFPGNSGGPVISRPENISIVGTKYNSSANLIGIVCSYIAYSDHAISKQTGSLRMIIQENSGLSIVHPVDRIIEVANIEKERIIQKFNNH